MRIQLTLLMILFSINCFGSEEQSIKDLFKKYDLIMLEKKTELIDEVFSQKFLKLSGGKEEFISKVKELPLKKITTPTPLTWRKGVKSDYYFAKLKIKGSDSEFILVKEKEKFKIDGTIGDAN